VINTEQKIYFELADEVCEVVYLAMYRVADKCLARPTSRCILFYGYNISFDASHVTYINILIFLQL